MLCQATQVTTMSASPASNTTTKTGRVWKHAILENDTGAPHEVAHASVSLASGRGVVLDFDASPRVSPRVATPPPTPPADAENGLDHGLEPLPWDPTVTYEPHEYEFPRPSQPPKTERHPTEKLYLKHDLMYIRYDAPIERKENGKCKIGRTRPPYRQITRQPKYKPDGNPTTAS